MNVLCEPDIPKAWKEVNSGEVIVADRIERIGMFYFNGRIQAITPSPEGDITLRVVTLAEEAFGGLGIQVMRLGQSGATCDGWESVSKTDPLYEELLAYSQLRG